MRAEISRLYLTVITFDPAPDVRALNHQRLGWPLDMKYEGPVVRFDEDHVGNIFPVIRIASGQEVCGPAIEDVDPLLAGAGLA